MRAVGWEFKLAAGQIDDGQVPGALPPVLGILCGLVHARGEFALPVVVAVKELDFPDKRIVGIEICEDIRAPKRTWPPRRAC